MRRAEWHGDGGSCGGSCRGGPACVNSSKQTKQVGGPRDGRRVILGLPEARASISLPPLPPPPPRCCAAPLPEASPLLPLPPAAAAAAVSSTTGMLPASCCSSSRASRSSLGRRAPFAPRKRPATRLPQLHEPRTGCLSLVLGSTAGSEGSARDEGSKGGWRAGRVHTGSAQPCSPPSPKQRRTACFLPARSGAPAVGCRPASKSAIQA